MAIQYTLSKKLDINILNVLQPTTYKLYYTSNNSNDLVYSGELIVGVDNTIPIMKDGHYRIVLSAEGEIDVTLNIDVIKFLQNSIIRDAYIILCGCTPCKSKIQSDCLDKAGKECLQYKAMFVKLLSFQNVYLPLYGQDATNVFNKFLALGALTFNCKTQNAINSIIQEECITGSVKDVSKLFKLYVALYWYAMYRTDKALVIGNTEELEFLDTKYMYSTISNCLCETCIDLSELEALFDEAPVLVVPNTFVFQYDDINFDIDDIAVLTANYLENNGTPYTMAQLEAGQSFTFGAVARFGFVLQNVGQGEYEIRDILNNVVTNIVFDVDYDVPTSTETYVSKEFITPSTLYYKFIKL